MKKLSFHPSPAMIVACVALFVALGGTATAVTYVVSSNSQIGPGTVSGHKPPTGKHANVIGGSINSTDLANGAATLGKLAPNSVNGARVVDGSLAPADVKSIVLRPHGDTDVATAASGVNVSYPLTGNTWTQKAGEVDLITGSVSYTKPAACSDGGDPTTAVGEVDINVDGGQVAEQILGSQPFGTDRTSTVTALPGLAGSPVPSYLGAPTSDQARTLTAQVKDFCFDPASDQNFTIHSVNVQVIALR